MQNAPREIRISDVLFTIRIAAATAAVNVGALVLAVMPRDVSPECCNTNFAEIPAKNKHIEKIEKQVA